MGQAALGNAVGSVPGSVKCFIFLTIKVSLHQRLHEAAQAFENAVFKKCQTKVHFDFLSASSKGFYSCRCRNNTPISSVKKFPPYLEMLTRIAFQSPLISEHQNLRGRLLPHPKSRIYFLLFNRRNFQVIGSSWAWEITKIH